MLSRLSSNRLTLRATLVGLLVLALLGGGWLWLRGSSLVAVEYVHVSGVHGAEAIEIRAALDDAAKRMTTMDFNASALRSAVASYAVVAGVQAKTGFPHTVNISVSERQPVAVLVSAGQRTAVAANGIVLGPALLTSSLPSVSGSVEPAPGARLGESSALSAVTVLGAAPAPLARFVARVYEGPEGLTAAMRSGLLVYFGNDTRPHAKWLSLARVLVSPSSAGALYIDVRLPERPAAGFSSSPSSSSSSSSASTTPLQTSASEPTAAALATSLANAVGGGATPASGSSTAESESASTAAGVAAGSSTSNGEANLSTPAAAGAASSPASGSGEASKPANKEAPTGAGENG